MGATELFAVIAFIMQNAPTMVKYVDQITESWKRDNEMTPAENARFQADLDAAKTDPAWKPDAE